MEELDKARQQAIARLIRQWTTTDTNRHHLRHLLNMPVDQDIPRSIDHCSTSWTAN